MNRISQSINIVNELLSLESLDNRIEIAIYVNMLKVGLARGCEA